MIRIKKNRCGYGGATGYECLNTTKLGSAFTSGEFTFTETVVPADSDSLDNYYNIPIKFTGMVTTLSPVFDMYPAPIPAPEESCANNVNPFNGGFLDAFSKYGDSVKGKINDDSEYMSLDKKLLIAFDEASMSAEGQLHPGIIEPMLNTDMNPVGIEGITSVDATFDGVMLALYYLTEWRKAVDSQLSAISGRLRGLGNQIRSENLESACTDFQVSLQSGNPVQLVASGYGDAPEYNVAGGTIYMWGRKYVVAGLPGIQTAPFSVYIEAVEPEKGAYIDSRYTPHLSTSKNTGEGIISILICGVRLLDSSEVNGVDRRGVRYITYQIFNYACDSTTDVGLPDFSESGFVYYNYKADQATGGDDAEGSYEIVPVDGNTAGDQASDGILMYSAEGQTEGVPGLRSVPMESESGTSGFLYYEPDLFHLIQAQECEDDTTSSTPDSGDSADSTS